MLSIIHFNNNPQKCRKGNKQTEDEDFELKKKIGE
jgi:hypothetical protein